MSKENFKLQVVGDFTSIANDFAMVNGEYIDELVKNHTEIDSRFNVLSDFNYFTYMYSGTNEVNYSVNAGGICWKAVYDINNAEYRFMIQFPKCPVEMTVDEEPVDVYTGLYVDVPVIPKIFANAIANEIMEREAMTKSFIEKDLFEDEND